MPIVQNYDVLLKKKVDNLIYELYPITKVGNVIVGNNSTLDKTLKNQELLNYKYDEGLNKLKNIDDYAEVNQLAFSHIKVDEKLFSARYKQDTLSIAGGRNISVDFDNNNVLVINADNINVDTASEFHDGLMPKTDYSKLKGIEDGANKYIHPSSNITPGRYGLLTIDSSGHVTSGSNDPLPIDVGGTGVTSYDELSSKLNVLGTDIELSSTSTNPVQNKVIKNSLDTKVDKVIGKSLISDTEIERLSTINNYDDTEINNVLDTKVDKIEGKSLISDTEIERLSTINNYDDTEINNVLDTKVDKVIGKSLISDTEIERLSTINNYDDTEINNVLDTKVDKIEGKSLISDTEIERLSTINNYDDEGIINSLSSKVDKIEGKSLISDTEIERLSLVYNYNDEGIINSLSNKVNKIDGKGLSTNDLTNELKESYDNTVNNSHTHTNKEIIDLLSKNENGDLLYNGISINRDTDLTGYATEIYVDNKVNSLVNSAPETLDTLKELSDALNNDANFANTITTELGKKVNTSDITDVVSNSHIHTNKTIIDKLGEDSNGKLLYEGNPINTNVTIDSTLSSTSANPVQNKAIKNALDTKVDKVIGKSLISDTEIERISTITNYDDTEINNAITNKVDKVIGKSLISDTEIERLSNITNYDDTEINNALDTKVDKIEGKSLISDTEIERLSNITNYDDTEINNALDTKVDKVAGKSLISDTEIERLSNITNYDDTEINNALDTKVDKVAGKSLSSNDFTDDIKQAFFDLEAMVPSHINNNQNPHTVTASQIGLGNLTNDKQVKGLSSGTTTDHIVTFGSDGYTIKDSGFTIGSNVPMNALFTDTKYNLISVINQDSKPTIRFANGSGETVNDISIYGSNGTTVTRDVTGNIKISSPVIPTAATTSSSGLMTNTMVSKLNGIADNANNYKHPLSTVTVGKYKRVNVDMYGHVTQGDNSTFSISEGGTGATTTQGILDNLGIDVSPTEINYLASTSANIQDQLNAKLNENTFNIHTNNKQNPHNVTAFQIGLDNLTNDRQVKGLSSGYVGNHIIAFGGDGYTIKDTGITYTNVLTSSNISSDYSATSTISSTSVLSQSGAYNLYNDLNTKLGNYSLVSHTHSYYLPLTGGDISGIIKARTIYPTDTENDKLGTTDAPWDTLFVRNIGLRAIANYPVSAGGISTTLGTKTSEGVSKLVLGNVTASGIFGSACGVLQLYSQGTGSVLLNAPTKSDNTWIDLPVKAGTLALTSEVILNNADSETTGSLTVNKDILGALKVKRASMNTASLSFENNNGLLGYIGMNTVDGELKRITTANDNIYTMLDSNNYKTYCTPKNIGAASTSHKHAASQIGLGNLTNDKQVKGLSSGTTTDHIIAFSTDGYTIKDSGITYTNILTKSNISSDYSATSTTSVMSQLGAYNLYNELYNRFGNYSTTTHTHAAYSSTNHTHAEYLSTSNYKTYCTPANIGAASTSHTHAAYSSTSHTHAEYLSTSNYKTYCTPANIGAASTSHTHAEYLPLTGGDISGIIKARTIYPTDTENDKLGTTDAPWDTLFVRNIGLRAIANYPVSAGGISTTLGTKTSEGVSKLVLGNVTASGIFGSACGVLQIYSKGTGSVLLTAPTKTDNTQIDLPTKAGTLALTSEVVLNNADSETTGSLTVNKDILGALKVKRPSMSYAALSFENNNGLLGYIGMNTVDGELKRITNASNYPNNIFSILDSNNYKTYCTPKNIGAASTNHTHAEYLSTSNYKTYCTPANIGAASTSHTHAEYLSTSNYKTYCTPANIGAASTNHTHAEYLSTSNYKTYCTPKNIGAAETSHEHIDSIDCKKFTNYTNTDVIKTITITAFVLNVANNNTKYIQGLIRVTGFSISPPSSTTYADTIRVLTKISFSNSFGWIICGGSTPSMFTENCGYKTAPTTSGTGTQTFTLKVKVHEYGSIMIEYSKDNNVQTITIT